MAKVLVVEDQESDRLLLQTLLQDAGHQVLFAKDGEEAVRLYLRKGVQVVVTDLQMPHVDGMELITELLALFPDAPIIAVSGKGEDQLRMAKTLGAVDAMAKPVDRDDLLAAVKRAADSPGAAPKF